MKPHVTQIDLHIRPGLLTLGPLVTPLSRTEQAALDAFERAALENGYTIMRVHDRVLGIITCTAHSRCAGD